MNNTFTYRHLTLNTIKLAYIQSLFIHNIQTRISKVQSLHTQTTRIQRIHSLGKKKKQKKTTRVYTKHYLQRQTRVYTITLYAQTTRAHIIHSPNKKQTKYTHKQQIRAYTIHSQYN